MIKAIPRREQIVAHAHRPWRGCSLSSVEAVARRLSRVRAVSQVVVSYTNRGMDVKEKLFAHVDGREEFPFLVTKTSSYCSR